MRVFFGLDLPAERILEIDHWRAKHLHCQGQPVPPENFHITLAFVGSIATRSLESLLDDADSLAGGNPLELRLNQMGYFQKPGIFWFGSSTTPPSLSSLSAGLRKVAANNGGRLERKPLQPHVTLYRRCEIPPPAPPAVPVIDLAWRHFTLFESLQGRRGVQYREIAQWSLQ
ncbi:MAG: RNA 2',3'-cyclic phosphodiesterase [Halioglobus sp.]